MTGEVKLLPASFIIYGGGNRRLLKINSDGTVEGEVEDAGEAAKTFVEAIRHQLEPMIRAARPTLVTGQLQEDGGELKAYGGCAHCGKPVSVGNNETFTASTDGKIWHYGCAPCHRPTAPTRLTDDVVKELVEQEIAAWAFAHDIDGAIRNDLIARIRKACTGVTLNG